MDRAPHPVGTLRPRLAIGGTLPAVLVVLVALAVPAMATVARASLPEPKLRLTTTLTLPVEPAHGGETGRALLRLESRAGQLAVEESTAVDEMLLRLERMGQTVAALQPLIATMPNAPGPTTPAPTCPGQPTAPAKPPEGPAGDMPWLLLAGGVLVLALLGLLWHYRRRGAAELGGDETIAWHTESPSMTLQATLPPTPFLPVSRKLEEASTTAVAADPVAETPIPQAVELAVSPPEPPPAIPAPVSGPVSPSEADLSLELAEVMLSMRLTDGAAQTLEDHIRAHPRQALIHWLKLLEIYRHSGQQADFEESALQLQQHFNVAPPEWPAGNPLMPVAIQLPSLEHYVHISGRIQELWPRRSCAEYLDRLLADNRGGTRTGFPPTVVEEILFLLAVLRP